MRQREGKKKKKAEGRKESEGRRELEGKVKEEKDGERTRRQWQLER